MIVDPTSILAPAAVVRISAPKLVSKTYGGRMAHIATATAPASRPVTTFGKRTRLKRSAISMVCAAAYCAIVSCDSPDKSENVFDFGIARQGASISKTFGLRTAQTRMLCSLR